MKKILFGMMAAAVLATSCAKELQDVATGDATVTFTVGTPEIATRAYSDGTTATELQYAVYNANGGILADLTGTQPINISTTVELKLTTGNTYTVAFWADNQAAPYTVDFANKSVSVNYTGVKSNNENLDAFYAWYTFTVTGAQTETVELKRPFAQLNIGTADYTASTSADYTPTQSKVVVKNICNTLDLENGVAKNEVEVDFALADIKKDEIFPVTGYEYLAMNYLLVNKGVVEVEFTYTDGLNAKTRTVGSVPVERNYRTNIYGNLLTSDVDINVEIKPDYNEPDYEADELQKAAAFGGEVTLTEDVVLKNPLEIQANMVLNLGGKTLTGVVTVAEGVQATIAGGKIVNNDKSVSGITSNGNLTLDNVEIESARHALRVESGKVVINGGTYKVAPMSNSTLHALNVGDNNTTAEVIIKGGTFIGPKGTMADSGSAVNVRNGSKVVIEGGNFSGGKNNTLSNAGTMTIKGGNFDQNPKAEWIAAGFKAVMIDGRYYVVANDTELVSTSAQFSDALAKGKNVLLHSDVNITKIDLTAVSNDIVIDANGNTITTASNYGIEVTAGKNITLKNAEVVITVNGDYINYAAGFKIANGDYAGQTIKLENCEIRMANTDWAYAINMPANVKNLNLVIDKCVLEGAIALQCWGDNNTITVTNSKLICNYTTSQYYTSYCVALQGDGTNNSENNTLTISNCEFSYSGVDNFNSTIKSVHAHGHTDTNTITVSDCTYVGVTAY